MIRLLLHVSLSNLWHLRNDALVPSVGGILALYHPPRKQKWKKTMRQQTHMHACRERGRERERIWMKHYGDQYFTLLFDLLKMRHLAAERGSISLVSVFDESDSLVILLHKMSLEPLNCCCSWFGFWSKFRVAKTPSGVCITKTLSAFGALHRTSIFLLRVMNVYQETSLKVLYWKRWKSIILTYEQHNMMSTGLFVSHTSLSSATEIQNSGNNNHITSMFHVCMYISSKTNYESWISQSFAD